MYVLPPTSQQETSCSLLGLLFSPDDVGNMLLQDVSELYWTTQHAFQKIALLLAVRTSNPTFQTESVNVLIIFHHVDFSYSVIMTPPN
jgi:hypothetical protein